MRFIYRWLTICSNRQSKPSQLQLKLAKEPPKPKTRTKTILRTKMQITMPNFQK